MTTLTLPATVLKKAKRQTKNHGLQTFDEYVQMLIQKDNYKPAVFSTRQDLEALLLDALNDPEPATPFTKKDFADLKKDLIAKARKSKT
jgi:hypothetical protein